MLRLAHVGKAYPGVVALADVSFEIPRAEIHALVGPGAAGLSTLARILAGACPDHAGEIVLDGMPIRLRQPHDSHRYGIAVVHQDPPRIPALTIAESIWLGREPRRALGTIDRRRMRAVARQALDRLAPHLDPRRPVATLDASEWQLVAIARAIAFGPRLLVLDEPASALGAAEVKLLHGVLRALRAEGVTTLYATHRPAEVFALADRFTVLRDGRLLRTVPVKETTRAELMALVGGESRPKASARDPERIGAGVLHVEQVSSDPPRPSRRGLVHIDFSLHEGEIVGVAGLAGSGRTTLLETLCGQAPRRRMRGTVRIANQRVRVRSPRGAMRHGIAYVPSHRQGHGLMPMQPSEPNLTLAALKRVSTGGIIRRGAERRLAADATSRFRLRGIDAHTPVHRLAPGAQVQVTLARALLTRPRILLLDEPTRGLDSTARADIHQLLRRLSRQGAAILMASSDVPELLALCDRILVLREGHLVATLPGPLTNEAEILAAASQPYWQRDI